MRNFTAPKHFNKEPFFTHKRLPRKLKKELKKTVPEYVYKMGVNVLLWYTMEENYKRFIIKSICDSKPKDCGRHTCINKDCDTCFEIANSNWWEDYRKTKN